MNQCIKCGKDIDHDKKLCIDCFKEEFTKAEKLIDENKRKNHGFILKSITVILSTTSFLIKSFVILILIGALFAFFFIPSFNGDIKNPEEKVALNFAATVAQAVGTYYAETDSSGFIGLKSGSEDQMLNYSNIHLQPPIDYKCEILDSIVVVTHRDGAKGEVRWR